MKTLLTANLSTKTASEGSDDWQPPVYTFGESIALALRFAETTNGATTEPDLDIVAMKAAVGHVDARPESGTWALQIGDGASNDDNTAINLSYDCSAAAITGAINGLADIVDEYGSAVVIKADGSWFVQFGDGEVEVSLRVVRNRLLPISLGRISAVEDDGIWSHEIRLTQTPVAFTDVSEAILPPPPKVTRLDGGRTTGGFAFNEIQALYVPPDFRGVFTLSLGDSRTGQLTVADDSSSLQEALEAFLGAGNIEVTIGLPFTANIEFVGDLKGTPQDLLSVSVLNPPPQGDLTFSIDLNKAPLQTALRLKEQVTLPLEVRIWTNVDDVVTQQVAFRRDITIQRPVIFPELATVPAIDWLRPPSPRDYIPFSVDQVITGQQHYTATIGDGETTELAIAHGLGTDAISSVAVRENISGGRLLGQGTDFEVSIDDEDSVVLFFAVAPALNSLAVCITTAGPRSAFQNHTHSIGQITGLQALLDAIAAQLATITDLLPTVTLSVADPNTGVRSIALPARTAVFPSRKETPPAPGAKIKVGGLLPAIHDATVIDFGSDDGLPGAGDDVNIGEVFRNDTGGTLELPGGLGRKTVTLPMAGYFGSDGRGWYQLTHAGTSTSYFPTYFERELWTIFINDRMLRTGQIFRLEAEIQLQMLAATTRMQCLLVIQLGEMPSQATPATTSVNLENVTWNIATPLLSQRLILGDVIQAHAFGCAIARAISGITATRSLYGASDAAGAAPATANFALRARLIQWDTENSVTGAKGLVYYASSGSAEIR
jgi:hypothetical protein